MVQVGIESSIKQRLVDQAMIKDNQTAVKTIFNNQIVTNNSASFRKTHHQSSKLWPNNGVVKRSTSLNVEVVTVAHNGGRGYTVTPLLFHV